MEGSERGEVARTIHTDDVAVGVVGRAKLGLLLEVSFEVVRALCPEGHADEGVGVVAGDAVAAEAARHRLVKDADRVDQYLLAGLETLPEESACLCAPQQGHIMNHLETISDSRPAPGLQLANPRTVLLAIVERLPRGRLLIRENGRIVADSGDKGDGKIAEIDVLDSRFYRAALFGGGIGAVEAYVRKWWETPDLTGLIRLFAMNIDYSDRWESWFSWLKAPFNILLARPIALGLILFRVGPPSI